MKVFLVGFMGSGKTTLGKKLAAKLNRPFVDLDLVFEEKEGCTIGEYFTYHGEAAFRKEEASIIRNTVYPANGIISTGGGVPCFHNNMDWMNANGLTIYINLPVKTLADRLGNAKVPRPVLGGKKGEELEKHIAERLSEREVFYKKARVSLTGINLTAEDLEKVIKENKA